MVFGRRRDFSGLGGFWLRMNEKSFSKGEREPIIVIWWGEAKFLGDWEKEMMIRKEIRKEKEMRLVE